VQNPSKIGPTNFAEEIGEALSFFFLTHIYNYTGINSDRPFANVKFRNLSRNLAVNPNHLKFYFSRTVAGSVSDFSCSSVMLLYWAGTLLANVYQRTRFEACIFIHSKDKHVDECSILERCHVTKTTRLSEINFYTRASTC